MIQQTVVLFVFDQNKNEIAFRLEIVAFVGETLSLRCTVTNSYQQVRFYIYLSFLHSDNCPKQPTTAFCLFKLNS